MASQSYGEATAPLPPTNDYCNSPLMLPSGNGSAHGDARRLRQKLYISHFLSTWNSRVFEYGAVLFISATYPDTLSPVSLYAVVRALSAIVCAPAIGSFIDQQDRLDVVRKSIVGQRVAVVLSCVGFGFLHLLTSRLTSGPTALELTVFGALAFLCCIEKVCSIMNLVAVERDWVVVMAGENREELQLMNSQMRRIDLICKLCGPLAISIVDGTSTTAAIYATLGMSILSVTVEYVAIAKVYYAIPALARIGDPETTALQHTSDGHNVLGILRTIPHTVRQSFRLFRRTLRIYFNQPPSIASIAASMLYLTVLSFSGSMVAYLLSIGYGSTYVGIARSASIASEVSATWLAPALTNCIGLFRAGLWFINWQAACLVAGTVVFWWADDALVASHALVAGVIASRVGLWGFDLTTQGKEVEPLVRGTFSSAEASLQNVFELLGYATTMVFADPALFRYPSLISTCSVLMAAALYAWFVRLRRGHLLHVELCGLKKANETERALLIYSI